MSQSSDWKGIELAEGVDVGGEVDVEDGVETDVEVETVDVGGEDGTVVDPVVGAFGAPLIMASCMVTAVSVVGSSNAGFST